MRDDHRELNDKNREQGDSVDFLEETAAETAPTGVDRPNLNQPERNRPIQNDRIEGDRETEVESGRGYGIFALALSILSLFFLPVVMGAAGIIVGFFARAKGANALGGWAIGIGIAAIVISLFAAPFL
jgi:hypothetical protein